MLASDDGITTVVACKLSPKKKKMLCNNNNNNNNNNKNLVAALAISLCTYEAIVFSGCCRSTSRKTVTLRLLHFKKKNFAAAYRPFKPQTLQT